MKIPTNVANWQAAGGPHCCTTRWETSADWPLDPAGSSTLQYPVEKSAHRPLNAEPLRAMGTTTSRPATTERAWAVQWANNNRRSSSMLPACAGFRCLIKGSIMSAHPRSFPDNRADGYFKIAGWGAAVWALHNAPLEWSTKERRQKSSYSCTNPGHQSVKPPQTARMFNILCNHEICAYFQFWICYRFYLHIYIIVGAINLYQYLIPRLFVVRAKRAICGGGSEWLIFLNKRSPVDNKFL